MATSAEICILTKDGKLKGVRCNYDGYVYHTGKILLENYNTKTLVTKLLSLGDMSTLQAKMNKPVGHSFSKPVDGYTIFYGRDRGEDNVSAKKYDSVEDVFSNCNVNYVYVFDTNNNSWYFCKPKGELESLTRGDVKDDVMAKGGEIKTNKELSDMYSQMAINIEEEMSSDKGGETSGMNYEKLAKLQKEKDKYTALSIKYDTNKNMAKGGEVGFSTMVREVLSKHGITKNEIFKIYVDKPSKKKPNKRSIKVRLIGYKFNDNTDLAKKIGDDLIKLGAIKETILINNQEISFSIDDFKNTNKMAQGGKVVENGDVQLPAGKYYVGDLCYVLHDEWDEVCDLTIKENECINGVFTLKNGTQFALYGTAYGDGGYYDTGGREYGVDSGTLGCVLVSKIDTKNKDNDLSDGNIIGFETSFTTGYMGEDEEEIYFGMVVINTGYEDEDDYDENDEDRSYARGGGVGEYWSEINESTLNERLPYDMRDVNEDEDLISGNIWIKFKKSPLEMPDYELKRAISEDFEYFGYGNQKPAKNVSLMDGSWGSFYIDVENLTLTEIKELLLNLPEQVQERLEDKKIKGYKDLGFDTYGQTLDLRVTQSEDEEEYAMGGEVGTETTLAFYGDKLKYIDYKNKTFKPIYFYEKLSSAKKYMEDEQKSHNKNHEHIILPYKNNRGTAYVIYRAVDKFATGGGIGKLPRKKFLLYTNPNNVTNRGYVAIGEDVKDVLRSSREYKDSYTILYQGTGTNEDLQKAKSMYSNYRFGNDEEIMAKGGGVFDNEDEINDIINTLRKMEVDGEKMQYILEQVGMEYQMLSQLIKTFSVEKVKNLLEERIDLDDDNEYKRGGGIDKKIKDFNDVKPGDIGVYLETYGDHEVVATGYGSEYSKKLEKYDLNGFINDMKNNPTGYGMEDGDFEETPFIVVKVEDSFGIYTYDETGVLVYEGGIEDRKIKGFNNVKPGDVAIDYNGEKYEVVEKELGKKVISKFGNYDKNEILSEIIDDEDFETQAFIAVKNDKNEKFLFRYDKGLLGAVVSQQGTKTIPGLDASKQLSILEVDALYRREPKLDDPYYPKSLIKQVGDIAYYMVMVNEGKFLLAMDTTGNYDDKWYFTSVESTNNMSTPKERGGADIRIELTNGNVTVLHGSSGEVLLNLQNVPTGTWDKLWDFLRNKLV